MNVNPERLVQTFLSLIGHDSPSGEEEELAQFLLHSLQDLGMEARRDDYGNVIALSGMGVPLLLSAHMDTVEPGRDVKARLSGGRIVSDGTTVLGGDPKAGIAAILEGLRAFSQEKPLPCVQVVLTRQEEIGLVGARRLDYSLIQAREGVVFDGDGPVNRVTNAAPSALTIRVEATGRAAHAGLEPENGLSAIRPLADLALRLPQGRLDPETTANVGIIQGGTVVNAVPEHATLRAEMRSRNRLTFERVRSEIEKSTSEVQLTYPDVTLASDLRVGFESYEFQKDHSAMDRVVRALLALNLAPNLGPSGGGTDTNVFFQHGIAAPVVGMGGGNYHTVREFVEIEQLVDSARFCVELLRSYSS